MLTPKFASILMLALAFGNMTSDVPEENQTAKLKLVPCRDKKNISEQEIDHVWNYCPIGDTEEKDSWSLPRQPPKIDNPKKPKYKIRDSNTCEPGMESVSNCNSNPDEKRCDDGSFPIIRQLIGTEGEQNGLVIRTFRLCPGDTFDPDIPRDQFIIEVVITPEHFRSFPILGSNLHSDPQKFSLRNGHSHFWAQSRSQIFNSNVFETPVKIRATPVGWNWKYGDETTRKLDFPGEPAPNHTLRDETPTSHSYKETGTYSVGLTTLFRGEFSVGGGPWQSIPGQAAVPSDPIEIDVWRTKKELIARD